MKYYVVAGHLLLSKLKDANALINNLGLNDGNLLAFKRKADAQRVAQDRVEANHAYPIYEVQIDGDVENYVYDLEDGSKIEKDVYAIDPKAVDSFKVIRADITNSAAPGRRNFVDLSKLNANVQKQMANDADADEDVDAEINPPKIYKNKKQQQKFEKTYRAYTAEQRAIFDKEFNIMGGNITADKTKSKKTKPTKPASKPDTNVNETAIDWDDEADEDGKLTFDQVLEKFEMENKKYLHGKQKGDDIDFSQYEWKEESKKGLGLWKTLAGMCVSSTVVGVLGKVTGIGFAFAQASATALIAANVGASVLVGSLLFLTASKAYEYFADPRTAKEREEQLVNNHEEEIDATEKQLYDDKATKNWLKELHKVMDKAEPKAFDDKGIALPKDKQPKLIQSEVYARIRKAEEGCVGLDDAAARKKFQDEQLKEIRKQFKVK